MVGRPQELDVINGALRLIVELVSTLVRLTHIKEYYYASGPRQWCSRAKQAELGPEWGLDD
jgi:hypothetical protein